MYKLIDKLVLFVICAALYIPSILQIQPDTSAFGYTAHPVALIVPLLVTITISAGLSFLEKEPVNAAAFLLFAALCIRQPEYLFFIPLLCYDVIFTRFGLLSFAGLVPFAVHRGAFSPLIFLFLALFILLAFFIKSRTKTLMKLRSMYYELLDNSKDISLELKEKNRVLLERQDYEISLATLRERNRIARDIHDNVGHLLSSSILQIGAVLATVRDEGLRESIGLIKDTLASAMDSIRESVHNLHEESVDLQIEIESLIRSFSFCPVQLDYSVTTVPGKEIKYCFISVTKEALNNISKHSNASQASVHVREHPALYQLVIEDNGTPSGTDKIGSGGIGLKNISDRVAALKGHLNISNNKGFRIFISIPKSQPV